ncbi:imelysin family protein [soil metagenome]
MTTRRKTWLGIGVAAMAGAALPTVPAAHAVPGIHAPEPATSTSDAARAERRMMIAQAASKGGGEGSDGEAGEIQSYALASTDPNAFKYDARDEIAAYAKGVQASYAASAAAARTMATAIDAMLAKPNATTLAAARKAWVAARPAYLVTEAYRFYDGPIEDIEGEVNAWPMNEAFIDYVEGDPKAGIINDKSDLSIAQLLVKNGASDESDVTLGWHAIEFLLWGQDLNANGPGARPASDYVAGKGNNDRRRQYLKLVTERLVANLGRLGGSWRAGVPDNYAATFQALEPREAIGRIFNGMAVLAGFELMSERMAVALDSGDQEDEHSCFSDTTHQDFVYDLKGIETVWTGTYPNAAGPGMRGLVARLDKALAAEVDGLFADASAKTAQLGDPWDKVLASKPGSQGRKDGEAAVEALGKLADGLKRAGNKLGVLVQIPSA